MIAYDQRILHDPDVGLVGDCFRTSLACILEEDPESVPHFYHDMCTPQIAIPRVNEFLKPRGLGYIEFHIAASTRLATIGVTGHYVLSGISPRPQNDCDHSVVGFGQFEVVHDPHPSRAGIQPYNDAYYCLGFIVRL